MNQTTMPPLPLQQLTFAEICGEHGSQRWEKRRSRFIPRGTPFDPSRCEVVPLPEADAKAFVTSNHYSASYPAARFRCGLIVKPAFGASYLAGCAVFSVPMQGQAIVKYLGVDRQQDGVELGRLVLLDDPMVGFNAESWFIARAFRLLRESLGSVKGVISYSDPLPRYNSSGEIVKPGHAGTIYKASGFKHLGRSSKRNLIVSKSGLVVSERALSKIRNGETGTDYACSQLVSLGAPERQPFEDGRTYVARALSEGGFRKVAHPGNHVFAYRW